MNPPLTIVSAEGERRLRDLENRRELFECCAEILAEDGNQLILVETVSYS
jgi:nicotinamide riboside kinase